MARKLEIGKAEKHDPALHMGMETLRGERDQRLSNEASQVDREKRIAQCHEIIGRVQGLQFIEKVTTVGTLMQLRDIKTTKVYKDLPTVGTWEDFCKYIGLSRQKVDEDLSNLATFGEEFLTTVGRFSLGYREMRQLRQLRYDGESFQISEDGKTVIIEGEAISLSDDAAPEIEAALEKLLVKNRTLSDRNRKLEKDFKGALKEETAGLQSEKKALLERVKALEIFEPKEDDREWSVKQMERIEDTAAALQLAIAGFIIDPRLKDDRHLQAMVNAHLQEAELALHDVRARLDDVIDMFNN